MHGVSPCPVATTQATSKRSQTREVMTNPGPARKRGQLESSKKESELDKGFKSH